MSDQPGNPYGPTPGEGDRPSPYGQPPGTPYGQPSYGQPPTYGQPPQDAYGLPGQNPYGGSPSLPQPGAPHPGMQQRQPLATPALVLGILSLMCCLLFLAPVAWILGHRSVREIDASGGALAGRSDAKVGQVLGIIGTVVLTVVVAALALSVFLVATTSGTTT